MIRRGPNVIFTLPMNGHSGGVFTTTARVPVRSGNDILIGSIDGGRYVPADSDLAPAPSRRRRTEPDFANLLDSDRVRAHATTGSDRYMGRARAVGAIARSPVSARGDFDSLIGGGPSVGIGKRIVRPASLIAAALSLSA